MLLSLHSKRRQKAINTERRKQALKKLREKFQNLLQQVTTKVVFEQKTLNGRMYQ